MASLVALMAQELAVSSQLIEDALKRSYTRYRKIRIPKRDGGFRVAIQPAAELKLLHEWLDLRLLRLLPMSGLVMAFQPGTSILKNANAHRESRYFVRVDLAGFFPSIRHEDLMRAVRRASANLPTWIDLPDFSNVIATSCFDRERRLPIGYGTSPTIANAVMTEFDNRLLERIASRPGTFGRARLTRYADDFVFSTDLAGACRSFVHNLQDLIEKTTSPRLAIKSSKTRYMSRSGGSTMVTGLRINNEGVVRVPAGYRDHVRLLLKLFANGRLKPEENKTLAGHLAHIEHVDPSLFTRLSYQYHHQIAEIRAT